VVELVEDYSSESIKTALGRLENRSYLADLGTALREAFRADFDPRMLQTTFEDTLQSSVPIVAV